MSTSSPVRYLCVCQGGNVRSVCLAWHLKNRGHEAIAVGLDYLSNDTLELFCIWSDYIIVMQEEFVKRIPNEYSFKVKVCEVGPDSYGTPTHKDLKHLVKEWLNAQNG